MFSHKYSGFANAVLHKTGLVFICSLVFAFNSTSLFAQYTDSKTGNSTDTDYSIETNVEKTWNQQRDENPSMLVDFTEGFEAVTFPPTGWAVQNLSSPVGTNTQCWNRFTTTPWAPQTGVGHAGANFNCTGPTTGTISGWLFGPVTTFTNGDQIRFWTRKGATDTFPDRLELRLSLNGASTNAGATATSVGDFTTLLVSVNPTLVTGVYPTTFTQFTGTISGLGTPTSGRFAFRYFVTNGGPSGANSDIISIDTVQFVEAVPTAARVSITGAVRTAEGRAIRNAIVQMTDSDGTIRNTRTNSFGYYRFEEVEVGASYVFNVSAKGYQFDSQIVSVQDNMQDLDFIAQ